MSDEGQSMDPAEVPPEFQALVNNPEAFVAFESEVMLSWWKDSPEGMQVTFLIHPEAMGDIHPFKHFLAKGSGQRGTRFWVRAVELTDHDAPVNQVIKNTVRQLMDEREGSGSRPSVEAAMLCRNGLFHNFVVKEIASASKDLRKTYIASMSHGLAVTLNQMGTEAFKKPALAEELSVAWVYAVCGIKSRKDLDNHPSKLHKYKAAIVEPFYQYREELKRSDAMQRFGAQDGE